MTLAFVPVAVALSLSLALGCKKQEPAPRVDPALRPGSGSAATVPAGSGSAVAVPAGSGSAVALPAVCGEIQITVGKAGLVVKRDTATPATLDTLEATLRDLAKTCVGPAYVTAEADIDYQSIITTMDLAIKVGFREIGLAAPGGTKPAPKTFETKVGSGSPGVDPKDPKAALKDTPIVVVTKTDVTIGAATFAIDALDATKLDAAFGAAPHSATSPALLVIQADTATTGKTINAIIEASQRAGFTDLLFAVKSK